MTLIHRPLLDELTIAGLAVAVVALILVVVLMWRMRSLRRSLKVLDSHDGPESVSEAIARVQAEAVALRADHAQARAELQATRADLADALRHVAVVRYDAFGDMGGRMSFTAALLDDSGDGLVITSINGRTEGRSYAKGVKSGVSENELSPEEQQAVKLAMQGPG